MNLIDAILLNPAPFDVWIAYRMDSIKGSGTLNDPWNGSEQEVFDELDHGSDENAAIFLEHGNFDKLLRGRPLMFDNIGAKASQCFQNLECFQVIQERTGTQPSQTTAWQASALRSQLAAQ